MDRSVWQGCRQAPFRAVRRWLLGSLICCISFSPLPAQTMEADGALAAEVAVPPAPAVIDASADPVADLAKRVAELEKELKSHKDFEKKSAPAKPDEKNADDVWIDTSTEKWTVKLGGHVQMDYITWVNADPDITEAAAPPGTKNYFEFRRLRLTADGTGYGVFDFRLQMTLEPATFGDTPPTGINYTPDVKDAYLSMNEIPWLGRLRIGHFFVPFSLEQVTNDTMNIFLERSIPTAGVFAADREVGIAFYNCTDDQRLTWTFGTFLDTLSEASKKQIDDNQGYRVSGRVTWLPYYDEPSNGRYLIHLGAGVLYTDDQDNKARFRARPQIHEGPRLIDSGSLNASNYTTGNLEAAVVWGRITVQSEAFLSTINLSTGNPATIGGAYAHLSYFLTGENRVYERFGQHGAQFGRNVPFTNFFLTSGGCGWGAWEAKARWSYLDLNDVNRTVSGTRFGGEYNDLTVGMNWYWSDRTRVMFDWIHPITSAKSTFGATQSDLLAMRFDFNW